MLPADQEEHLRAALLEVFGAASYDRLCGGLRFSAVRDGVLFVFVADSVDVLELQRSHAKSFITAARSVLHDVERIKFFRLGPKSAS